MVQQLRPARILVLGLAAARAVLGRSDALGRLRAEPHQAAGVPTVVTYDPSYLLRAAHAKPAAWADLCRAQTLGQTVTAR
jgi:DNA polymerase